MTHRRLLVLALPLLLSSSPAWAQRIVHRVRIGDTLASISNHYYGTESHAAIVGLANGIDAGATLKPGEGVRVPTAWTYTARKASTLEELARSLLGDRRRWPALSAFNKIGRKKRLKAGKSLTVPFAVPYTPSSGESYADVARRFLGNSQYASLIASYNFAKTAQPPSGAQLEIPIGNVRIDHLVMEGLVSDQLLGVSRQNDRERREALQEANALLRRGEYWGVPLKLTELLAREISADDHLAEVYKLLAIAYVALDRDELAVRAFQAALLRQPTLSLDQVSTSPKVLRAFVDAKSRMQRSN